MTAIKDRHGRRIELTVYGAAGAARELDAEALEAALRVKRALSGKPELCAKAILKTLGLAPVRLGIRLWNGKEFLLNVPADLGNFLCDLDGIIIRDQYNAGDLAGKTVVDAGANSLLKNPLSGSFGRFWPAPSRRSTHNLRRGCSFRGASARLKIGSKYLRVGFFSRLLI